MATSRREFLKGTAWMGAAALVSGCTGGRLCSCGRGAPMWDFAVPPLRKVRVGCVGLGERGEMATHRLSQIPGLEIAALCDIRPEAVAKAVAWLKKSGKPVPREFVGAEAWRAMCDWDGIDVAYIMTPWALHAPMALGAMRAGKHALVEVPAAMTLDECYEMIETCEATRRHCMMLENSCYGDLNMFTLNLCRSGVLGELKHGECSYIHDLRSFNWNVPNWDGHWSKHGYYDYWRLKWNAAHRGNMYPTHGIGPMCQFMNINRGDKFDYLVSMECKPMGLERYAQDKFPEGSWQRKMKIASGDMNTTLIKTHLGRTIMLQHDVSSPRPHIGFLLLSGTKGTITGDPRRLGVEKEPGSGVKEFSDKEYEEYREKYRHPLWKKAGEIAKKVGGHGGTDFICDLRWAYCLQNGLPLDMNVYDLATWCSICELTERSVNGRSKTMDVPDFTRGKWKTAKPLGIVDVDIDKMGLDADRVQGGVSAAHS